MNDFNLIEPSRQLDPLSEWNTGQVKRRLTPADANEMHLEALAYLEKELALAKAKGLPVIVAGHHAPSFRSRVPGGRSYNNGRREAYYCQLDAFIEAKPHIYAWLHGHTHDSCAYKIGNTRVISNQRGYAHEYSAEVFDTRGADIEMADIERFEYA